jgi:hypothetical protein
MAVKESEIYKATLDTTVLEVLNQMYRHDFTNVPVFDEGCVWQNRKQPARKLINQPVGK